MIKRILKISKTKLRDTMPQYEAEYLLEPFEKYNLMAEYSEMSKTTLILYAMF